MKSMKDNIDFAKEPVGRLFRKMFLPTLVSMVSMVVLNITDGAFVGHGVGSNALAAVNIIAPLFMIIGGIGLMFGIGCSVVASIHLSRGKQKVACLNATQGLLAGFLLGVAISVTILSFQEQTCLLFGSSKALLPLATSYLKWLALFMPLCIVANIGMFMIRLDGSPRLAMWLNIASASLNIVGDYVLIFPCGMGLQGAAIATSASFALQGVATLVYLFFFSHTIKFCRIKLSYKSLLLSLRNVGYQMRIGMSAFLGEMAISAMFIIGNYQFMKYMGEDGVAAFSVCCYLTPICFMFGNSIVQSSQPIISFAHGQNNRDRILSAMRINLLTAVACGILGSLFIWLASGWVCSTFLPTDCRAWALAEEGLPLFGTCFLFVILNLTLIGYYQSTEKNIHATLFTILRGLILLLPAYILMPKQFGETGLWLSQLACEVVAFVCLALFALRKLKISNR